MRLQIVRIVERGRPNAERIHLRATADANLSYYVLLDTTYINPNAISNLLRHAFWFPTHQVRAGDNIVLYTGTGVQKSQPDPSGVTNHFFYWGLESTVWNNTGDCAVLMELNSWQTSLYE